MNLLSDPQFSVPLLGKSIKNRGSLIHNVRCQKLVCYPLLLDTVCFCWCSANRVYYQIRLLQIDSGSFEFAAINSTQQKNRTLFVLCWHFFSKAQWRENTGSLKLHPYHTVGIFSELFDVSPFPFFFHCPFHARFRKALSILRAQYK